MKKTYIDKGIIRVLIIFLIGIISNNLSAQVSADTTEVLLKLAKKVKTVSTVK